MDATAIAAAELLRTLARVLQECTCLDDKEREARIVGWAAGTAERVADALARNDGRFERQLMFTGEDLAGYITRQQAALTSYVAKQTRLSA